MNNITPNTQQLPHNLSSDNTETIGISGNGSVSALADTPPKITKNQREKEERSIPEKQKNVSLVAENHPVSGIPKNDLFTSIDEYSHRESHQERHQESGSGCGNKRDIQKRVIEYFRTDDEKHLKNQQHIIEAIKLVSVEPVRKINILKPELISMLKPESINVENVIDILSCRAARGISGNSLMELFKKIQSHLNSAEQIEVVSKGLWYLFETLPKEIRTKDLCEGYLVNGAWSIDDIPESYINKEFLMPVIDNNADFPMIWLYYDSDRLLKLLGEADLLELFDLAYHHNIFGDRIPKFYVLERSGIWIDMLKKYPYVLQQIPKDQITVEMCWVALTGCSDRNHGSFLFNEIPESIKTDNGNQTVIQAFVSRYGIGFEYLKKNLTGNEWRELVVNNPEIFEKVPEVFRNDQQWMDGLCDHPGISSTVIMHLERDALTPKRLMSLSKCIHFMKDLYELTSKDLLLRNRIMGNKELVEKLTCSFLTNSLSFIWVIRFLQQSETEYADLIKTIRILEFTSSKYKYLAHVAHNMVNDIPIERSNEILNALDQGVKFERVTILLAENLYNPVNPLSFLIKNPFLGFLKASCFTQQSQSFNEVAAQRIESFIKQDQTEKDQFITSSFCDIKASFGMVREISGGRTLLLAKPDSNRALYLKFKKEGEPEAELIRESRMHRFFAENPDILTLKSEVPEHIGLYKLELTETEDALIHSMVDKVEIITENDRRFVYAYCFATTSSNYSHYAHTPVPKTDGSLNYQVCVEGILKYFHDIGAWGSAKVAFTSTLPAFHDTSSERAWLALHSAMGYGEDFTRDPLPGTFGAWNTTATERPDVSPTGLRDLGDFEFLNEIDSYQKARDAQEEVNLQAVGHNTAFLNSIMHNMLAALMLYGRLNQSREDYHIGEEACISRAATFHKQLCDAFLDGFYQTSYFSEHPAALSQYMGIGQSDQEECSKRVALEQVYWTTQQPKHECQNGKLVFSYPNKGQPECDPRYHYSYAVNLRNNGELHKNVYPDALDTKSLEGHYNNQIPVYPEDFHNVDGKLNLGANNATFPLISAIKFGSLLLARLLPSSRSTQEYYH